VRFRTSNTDLSQNWHFYYLSCIDGDFSLSALLRQPFDENGVWKGFLKNKWSCHWDARQANELDSQGFEGTFGDYNISVTALGRPKKQLSSLNMLKGIVQPKMRICHHLITLMSSFVHNRRKSYRFDMRVSKCW